MAARASEISKGVGRRAEQPFTGQRPRGTQFAAAPRASRSTANPAHVFPAVVHPKARARHCESDVPYINVQRPGRRPSPRAVAVRRSLVTSSPFCRRRWLRAVEGCASEGPHAALLLALCPWCRKHSAYCPTDFLKWSWRGPLIVEEIRRSDVRSQRRMVAVLVAPTSPCTRSVNYAYAVDALADPCPHVQADVFCLQETQDKTFCSTFVPAFRSQYVPFQSAPTYGAYMRYRYDLTKSTFVRCAPGVAAVGPDSGHTVDIVCR